MGTWQAVAPIAPLEALPNSEHPIGPGVAITAIPQWFKEEVDFTKENVGRLSSLDSQGALVCTFDADSYGDPDPSWKGSEPRSKQDAAIEAVHMAGLALSLARPSALHIEAIVLTEPQLSRASSMISIRPVYRFEALSAYASATLGIADLDKADSLATAIRGVQRQSTVWTALRFFEIALCETEWAIRLLQLWVALEALFGPEDRSSIHKRLVKRIARFLNPSDDNEGRVAYQIAFEGYEWRCAASHGARLQGLTHERAEKILLQAESMVRTCLRKILSDPADLVLFNSAGRDADLDRRAANFHPPP